MRQRKLEDASKFEKHQENNSHIIIPADNLGEKSPEIRLISYLIATLRRDIQQNAAELYPQFADKTVVIIGIENGLNIHFDDHKYPGYSNIQKTRELAENTPELDNDRSILSLMGYYQTYLNDFIESPKYDIGRGIPKTKDFRCIVYPYRFSRHTEHQHTFYLSDLVIRAWKFRKADAGGFDPEGDSRILDLQNQLETTNGYLAALGREMIDRFEAIQNQSDRLKRDLLEAQKQQEEALRSLIIKELSRIHR